MSGTTYAQVIDGSVVNVIEAGADFIAQLEDSASYVQVFNDAIGEREKRFNYPSIGDAYDSTSDAFYSPTAPFESWVMSPTFQWQAPVKKPQGDAPVVWDEPTLAWVQIVTQAPTPMPDDGKPYKWDEPTLAWVEVE